MINVWLYSRGVWVAYVFGRCGLGFGDSAEHALSDFRERTGRTGPVLVFFEGSAPAAVMRERANGIARYTEKCPYV